MQTMTSKYDFNPAEFATELGEVLPVLAQAELKGPNALSKILKTYPRKDGRIFSKQQLVRGYYYLTARGDLPVDAQLLQKIRMKPTRSLSGVLPLTVLTRPFPCPGKCIFCPNDVRMPKSYLRDEPGAQRAERNHFDPYLQTYNRLLAFHNTGHEVAKIELIILGGTWSYYPEAYQVWFIKRCFDALNDFGIVDGREGIGTRNIFADSERNAPAHDYNKAVLKRERTELQGGNLAKLNRERATWDELYAAHTLNESAQARCVGLVIETRPDFISEKEVLRVRKLGATKTQIGFQSLSDSVLDANKRGHDVDATRRAVGLVRSAGFKLHAHWMPNLYGSTVERDREDYLKLYTPDFQPDELKIYPCSLIESAELMDYYKDGRWRPYTEEELSELLAFCLANTPRYVRLTRVIRDIPSQDIVVGNKKTNFREVASRAVESKGWQQQDIRAREIKGDKIDLAELTSKVTEYSARNSFGPTRELFLEYVTPQDKVAGFLRLSLPEVKTGHFIPELNAAALIREVHVYGPAQNLGQKEKGVAQHIGLGTRLVKSATELAAKSGYGKLSVISAIGTRKYYEKLGFERGDLYQHLAI